MQKTIVTKHGTLLQKALAVNGRRKTAISAQEIELGMAWMQDKVTITQIMKALTEEGTGNVYAKLSIWIREAHRKGQIRVVK